MKLSKKYQQLITLSIVSSLLISPAALAQENYNVLSPVIKENQVISPYNNNSLYKTLPKDQGYNSSSSYDNSTKPMYNRVDNYGKAPLKGSVSSVPMGTNLRINTNATINSLSSRVGDIFTAKLVEPIYLKGRTVIPDGSEVIGQVTFVEKAGRGNKAGTMEIKFISIKPPYAFKVPIVAKLVTFDNTGILKGGSLKKQIVTSAATGAVATAGGTLAGLSLGSLIGGAAGAGAVFGTAVGGLLGIGYIIGKKGKEVVIPRGTDMTIVLEQPLSISK